jgi:hypothetical protein
MTTEEQRHALLIAAGWVCDPASDLATYPVYTRDGDPTRYSLAAAWDVHCRETLSKGFTDPRRSRPL